MNLRTSLHTISLVAVAGFTLAACSSGADAPAESPSAAAATASADAMEPTPSHDAMEDDAMTDDAMAEDAMSDDEAMAKEESEEPAANIDVPKQLEFTTTTLADGAEFDGVSLAGKDTLLWFWAPWCPTCQAEASEIAAAAANLPEGVSIVGVPGRSDVGAMKEFTAKYGLEDFDHLVDEDGSLWSGFNVAYQPAFAFINDDGTVETLPGSLSAQGVIDAANELAAS
ncbi:redoxin family protein [Demequina aurantiaca]|uniref:redoxin family protein n=1 Tax=Demequina aurantiaca TaxID=676200 RepID=UPI000A9A1277|nr:redoxin family protein [Demequina aurantiaca]